MKRLPASLLSVILSGLGAAANQDAAPAKFEAATTQVRVDVLVSNAKGPVLGLRAEDFLVSDEGQPVALNFVGAGEESLNILMLLDVSGSMRGFLEQVAKKARSVLGLLKAEDKVGVMVFSKDTDYFRPFTTDMDRAANAIDQAVLPSQLPAGTAINAALLDAAEAFRQAGPMTGHRSVFILTDNKGLNYQTPDELALEKLWAQDIVLNAIVTKNAQAPRPVSAAEQRNPDFSFADVFKLAAATGGEVLRTERADEAFAQLIGNLRKRYVLTYRAPAAGDRRFRRIQISLTKAAQKRVGKAVIRARSGYYTGS